MRELAEALRADYAECMPTLLARNIRQLRAHLGLNQTDFAEKVGAHQSYISKWESKGIVPESGPLERIANLAGSTISLFRSTEWRVGGGVVSEAGHRGDRSEQAVAASADAGEAVAIIRLDLSLPMGPGALVDDYVEEEPVLFDLAYLRALARAPAERLRLARGIGDSMFPTLQTSDQVWIDTTQNQLVHADRIYAATINGGAAIKRLRPVAGGRRVLVISDNKTIESYEVDADDVRIWGRVIRFMRDL